MMPPAPYHIPGGAIGLELSFGLFTAGYVTSTSTFLRKYNTRIEIDGVLYERKGGAWHVFPIVAGWHFVRVAFRARPSFLSSKTGAAQRQVHVYPNTMARLRYDTRPFWPLLGGSLTQVG